MTLRLILAAFGTAVAVLASCAADAARPIPFVLPGTHQLLLDVSGIQYAGPQYINPAGNQTFFTANDGIHGCELWVSDGSIAGTRMVADVSSSTYGCWVSGPSVALGNVFIFFGGATGGTALWRSDGTAAGTYPLSSTIAGFNAIEARFAKLDGVAYIAIGSTASGRELWRTDGATAGTYLVTDINPGSGNGVADYPLAVSGLLLFPGASDGVTVTLWRSDGTAAGTKAVKTINPSGDAAIGCRIAAFGKLFFAATDGVNGRELWVSDGTETGTFMVRDINVGSGGSDPCYFTEMNGHVYFTATSPTYGTELWRTDGTAAGTVLVKDINPGAGSSIPLGLTSLGNRLFFVADDGSTGNEPWTTDGTAAGTVILADLRPGPISSVPVLLGRAGDHAYFSANDGVVGTEPYRTDGVVLELVGNLNAEGAPSEPRANRLIDVAMEGSKPLSYNGVSIFFAASGPYTGKTYVDDRPWEGLVLDFFYECAVTNGVLYAKGTDTSGRVGLWKLPPVNPDVQKISIVQRGKSDILLQHAGGSTAGWVVDGGKLLGTSSPLTSFGSAFRVKGIGDFNGGGSDDIVMRDSAGNTKVTLLAPASDTSMYVIGYKDIAPAGLNWDIAGVGDFDGDGKDDILWREVAGYNFMYTNYDFDHGVVQSAVPGLGIDWKVGGIADFDRDGKADIFWRNINGANAIWLMNGPAVKQVVNVPGLGADWSIAGIADFNRNGRPDILWRNVAGYNGIWMMDRTAVDFVVNVPGVTPDWRVVGTGDYNGDGFADILWEQTATAARVIWLMNAGAYQSEEALPSIGGPGWEVVNPVSNR